VASGAVGAVVQPKVEKLASKPVEKPVQAKPEPVIPETNKAEAAKAQALLEGKEPNDSVAGAARFVVQVGAFSDAVKAREARVKLEAAGLKTYTQVVNPKDGKRIRVRVGPFESKAQAEAAASKIKKLDLPAAILEL
jgi:DedD protein